MNATQEPIRQPEKVRGQALAAKRRQSAQWSESDARAALDEVKRHGKSIYAYAREIGVASQRFYAWRDRLADIDAIARPRSPTCAFLPVEVTPTAVSESACMPSPLEIVLAHNRVIRVGEQFDEATLTRLIATLESMAR